MKRKVLNEKEVLDVYIYGSFMKGEEAEDIDFLILFKEKEKNELIYNFRKSLEKLGLKAHVIGKTYDDLFEVNFLGREGILADGFSLQKNKLLSELYGFTSYVIFRYDLSGKSDTERTKFYYSLHGRSEEKGVMDIYNAIRFSDNVIFCSSYYSNEFAELFDNKKIKFEMINVLIPKRLADKKFLEKK